MVLIRQIQIARIKSNEIILNAEDVVKKLNNPWAIAASARPFKDPTTNLENFESVLETSGTITPVTLFKDDAEV